MHLGHCQVLGRAIYKARCHLPFVSTSPSECCSSWREAGWTESMVKWKIRCGWLLSGLFSCIMRELANLTHDGSKWIVLDGDIDPMWIESLNTVMDDNKVSKEGG